MSSEKMLYSILSGNHIRSVYQPIVDLRDGVMLGYEALSRITFPDCPLNIEQLFAEAAKSSKLWELEKLCRTQALQGARVKPTASKLFINVDTNIIYDQEFITGFTQDKLDKLDLNPDEIIFEVTEKSAVYQAHAFTEAISHYQRQGFKIAIDDFGSGYSGLARACALSPNYLKIDMSLVRNIHQDTKKRSAVLAIVKFCRDVEIQVIAEGIETKEELVVLMELDVDYGQGYLLGRPQEEFQTLHSDVEKMIRSFRVKEYHSFPSSNFDTVGMICQKLNTVSPDEMALPIYEEMITDSAFTQLCVVDKEGHIYGILTRSRLFGRFGGQFGYNLNARRTARELVSQDYLAVDWEATVDDVAMKAMKRDATNVYDNVIVTKFGQYFGVVTVRDLLMSAIRIREKNAADANPLTGLPGNTAIQRMISSLLEQKKPYAIMYLDLDNFKAYNDAYGFSNGDLMLKAVAQAITFNCSENDFIGHIGGDDFVVITHDMNQLQSLSNNIIDVFARLIEPLYSAMDLERGFISSYDRNGFKQDFPIVTLSIAIVTNQSQEFEDAAELLTTIAKVKSQSKQKPGNAIVIL